jgi:hypothetical protein
MPAAALLRRRLLVSVAAACVLLRAVAGAQGLTGTLIGTVTDPQGSVLAGAVVRISSTALIGGSVQRPTDQRGQLRFPALPPGTYELDIDHPGFAPHHEEDIYIGAGATLDVPVRLRLANLAESVAVEGGGLHIDARDPGFGTRFGPEDLSEIPTRRVSMQDLIRASPGISPTSPSSGTITTVSAFGSGTNENQFLVDGTNFTCPCNGVARSEPGIDFIQEIHVQGVGASAEFGNVQGAVINVVTRQGGNRFQYDASYYGQAAGLTSQPVLLPLAAPATGQSGYTRTKYRDVTTNLGGPAVRDRLWFFGGYQHLRDYDSQPGTDPALPRTYEQDKIFGKITWQLAPGWQLVQNYHQEFWVNPEQPSLATPFEATLRRSASVPAITFGHLTHTVSANTLWDVRVGRFVYSSESALNTGDPTIPSRRDTVTGITSGNPPQFGALVIARTTAKATLIHYRPGFLGADHEWKVGGQIERGEHRSPNVIPTGERYVDSSGLPFQQVSSAPSNTGGLFITTAGFVSDAITVGNRLTINAGLRFDHHRAISQDLHAVDLYGVETDEIVSGLGTLYTWNLLSPRLGVTTRLTADGRTLLRGSYGRFYQGVLTGELAPVHPGATPVTTLGFDAATGDYTRLVSRVTPEILQIDPDTRAPRTDEYSIGVDRELGRRFAVSLAYVHKDGAQFIGWTDVGGVYSEGTRTLANGSAVPVFVLQNALTARRYLLTNADDYSMTYDGLVMAVDRRRANGWQMFGSYTFSRAKGLQPSSGATAAGAQVSTVSPPPAQTLTFGRDPNDLTNARGLLPNDRPHVFRMMGSVDVPGTGLVVAANLGHFSGKPWAAAGQVSLRQNNQQRILLEPRGSQRLSSQTLLDLRLSRSFAFGKSARVDVLLDVLNVLNSTAEESILTDILTTETLASNPNFGRPTVFVDPRRAMLGVRLNLGR